jgi:general secretion pathway protein J
MTMTSRLQRRTNAGFTLLEALIATALMGLVLAALATIVGQWLPNWNRGIVRLQVDERIALVLDRLAADLAAAEFIPAGRGSKKPIFDGQDHSVTFVRTAFGPDAGPGLQTVRIAELNSTSGPILVRTRAPFAPAPTEFGMRSQPRFTDPVVLLRPPYRLAFAYAGTDRVWRNTWQQRISLPRAIKFTLRDGATHQTVSTAATLHIELPVQCINAKSWAECLTQLRTSETVDRGNSHS